MAVTVEPEVRFDDEKTVIAPAGPARDDGLFGQETVMRTIEPERRIFSAPMGTAPVATPKPESAHSGSSSSASESDSDWSTLPSEHSSKQPRRRRKTRSHASGSVVDADQQIRLGFQLRQLAVLGISVIEAALVKLGIEDAEGVSGTFQEDFAAGHYDMIFERISRRIGKTSLGIELLLALIATTSRHVAERRRRIAAEQRHTARFNEQMNAYFGTEPAEAPVVEPPQEGVAELVDAGSDRDDAQRDDGGNDADDAVESEHEGQSDAELDDQVEDEVPAFFGPERLVPLPPQASSVSGHSGHFVIK